MKKIDPGQLVSILANIGVVAGIVFLGFELQQNNALMEAEARFNRASLTVDSWTIRAENGELTELLIRSANNGTLTEVESERVASYHSRVLVAQDYIFRELPEDSPERRYVRELMRRMFSGNPSFQTMWNTRKPLLSPEFVEFVETSLTEPTQ